MATRNASDKAFSVRRRSDGIAVVTIDLPGESQNVLQASLIEEATALFDELEADTTIKGLIFISGKPGSFIAGADIKMLQACETPEAATGLSEGAQAFFDRLSGFKAPVVAAINGSCLGGGLEFALACGGRVCTDDPKTALGVPEVQLGVLPGGGGTQRLPRLIGIAAALELMLTGKQVRPHKAKRLGLVDDVVPATILEQAAVKRLVELRKSSGGGTKPRFSTGALRDWALEGNPLGRRVLFQQARKRLRAQTGGHYPAPERIVDCVERGIDRGMKAGLKAEARNFGELAVTPVARELMTIYFATVAMKKDTGVEDPKVRPLPVHRVGVLGAGLMGAGISFVTIDKAHTPVRLKDVKPDAVNRGLKYVADLIAKRRKRRALTPFEASVETRRLTPTLGWSGFGGLDLVIEAVFEDIELKHAMVRDVEAHTGAQAVFATNTSSIPIARIAEASRNPERILGMHYFSPVEKMPLLEVIATDKTAPEAVATAVAFGRKQGKTVIVVKDGAGFYVNRILVPYINEAGYLLGEGVAIDRIDKALRGFGFPVGPFALLDEVGLDVGAKVQPILHAAFGDRMKPSGMADTMLRDGRYGKKSGKGFYRYDAKAKKGKKEVDESVYSLLRVSPDKQPPTDEIVDRCVLMMVNEAVRCLDEGVIRSARDGDIGAIFGIGFPPFLGGPFRYAQNQGIQKIVSKLESLEQRFGDRFKPADALVRLAEKRETFYR